MPYVIDGLIARFDDYLAGIGARAEDTPVNRLRAEILKHVRGRAASEQGLFTLPEIERFRGNSRSDWFFAFLDAFPTPASITALPKESKTA